MANAGLRVMVMRPMARVVARASSAEPPTTARSRERAAMGKAADAGRLGDRAVADVRMASAAVKPGKIEARGPSPPARRNQRPGRAEI